MGLNITVGVLAEAAQYDAEALDDYRRDFAQLNHILVRSGLGAHREPDSPDPTTNFDMIGYSGLHYLRRIAYYLADNKPLPPPGPGLNEARVVDDEYRRMSDAYDERYMASAEAPKGLRRWLGGANSKLPRFSHLLMHGDADGIYIPQAFDRPLAFEPPATMLGLMIGSSQRLLEECQVLAVALRIPEGLSEDDDIFEDAIDDQGAGALPYAIETFTCLQLIDAAKASIKTGAAMVFQ